MNKKQFGPKQLRNVLIFVFVAVLLGGAGLFYTGLGTVRDYSEKVNQRLADSEASGKQVNNLQKLKKQLSQSDSLVAKANRLFITPDQYQPQVLTDVKRYADNAGVSIESTSFDAANSIHTVKVKLKNPVPFRGLVTFLHSIEGSLPKLQVKSLSVSRSDRGDLVTVQEITIGVSVR